MEILSEKTISIKQAAHHIKKTAKESFIEEDEQLVKSLNLIATELSAHMGDIIVPEEEKDEEVVEREEMKEEDKEEKEEEPKEEEPEKKKKRRHHRSK